MFDDGDSRVPLDRSMNFGFRCMKSGSNVVPREAMQSLSIRFRDFAKEKPVPDDVFQYFRSMYSYDKTGIDAVVESIDRKSEDWTKEKITFQAAYGNERVPVYIFVPRNTSPPYQTIIFFPSGAALNEPSSQNLEDLRLMDRVTFLLKSGRALVFPIYQGTFERNRHTPWTPAFARDLYIEVGKDLRRTIDYLETRKEFDKSKLGYFGISYGASIGPVMVAVEDRIKVAVWSAGGLDSRLRLAEADPINFLRRVKIPVLMINGRYDHDYPVEVQQVMFRLLSTRESDKRHSVYDAGHAVPQNLVIKETLSWFDRYLGPVR